MAVQKSRKTRSKRGMRRSHDGLSAPTLSIEKETGEAHLRHHVSKLGYYRGKQVISPKAVKTESANDNHIGTDAETNAETNQE